MTVLDPSGILIFVSHRTYAFESVRYKPFATSISKIIRNIFLKVKTLVSCHPRKDRKRCVCGWMDAATLPCWAWMAGAWSGLMAMSGNGLKPSIQRCRRQSRSNVVNGCGEAQNLSKSGFRCVGWISKAHPNPPHKAQSKARFWLDLGRFGRIFFGGKVCVFVDFCGSEAIWTYKTSGLVLAHCVLDGIACWMAIFCDPLIAFLGFATSIYFFFKDDLGLHGRKHGFCCFFAPFPLIHMIQMDLVSLTTPTQWELHTWESWSNFFLPKTPWDTQGASRNTSQKSMDWWKLRPSHANLCWEAKRKHQHRRKCIGENITMLHFNIFWCQQRGSNFLGKKNRFLNDALLKTSQGTPGIIWYPNPSMLWCLGRMNRLYTLFL